MHSPTLSTYPQRDDCDVITQKYPKCVRTRHSPRRYDEAQATGIHRIQEAFKKIARIAHNFILEQTPRGPHKNVLNLSRPLSYTESEPQNLVALEKRTSPIPILLWAANCFDTVRDCARIKEDCSEAWHLQFIRLLSAWRIMKMKKRRVLFGPLSTVENRMYHKNRVCACGISLWERRNELG